MTAQIVVLTKLCAVVASDSSVTLSTAEGRQRAFPTAEKILPLPEPHTAVVVMSGSAELLGVPYSVLIGEWMRTLSAEPLHSLADYADLLAAWIEAQRGLFTESAQRDYLQWMLRDYFLAVRTDILRRCEEEGLTKDAWQSPKASSVIAEVVASRLEQLEARPKLTGWEGVDCDSVLRSSQDKWEEVRDWVFDDTPRTAEGDAGLARLAARLLAAYEPFSRDTTLVFVGFGSEELFPVAHRASLQGIVDGRLRMGAAETTAISLEMGASIMPFGQTEAVNTFLRGYNAAFLTIAHDQLQKGMEQVGTMLGPDATTELDQRIGEMHSGLEDAFEAQSWESFLQPMLDTVAALPQAELARMAESLVGLQVLRQLTQAEAETVGGPIDVAVLTRSQGLRWARHKTLAGMSGGSM